MNAGQEPISLYWLNLQLREFLRTITVGGGGNLETGMHFFFLKRKEIFFDSFQRKSFNCLEVLKSHLMMELEAINTSLRCLGLVTMSFWISHACRVFVPNVGTLCGRVTVRA